MLPYILSAVIVVLGVVIFILSHYLTKLQRKFVCRGEHLKNLRKKNQELENENIKLRHNLKNK